MDVDRESAQSSALERADGLSGGVTATERGCWRTFTNRGHAFRKSAEPGLARTPGPE